MLSDEDGKFLLKLARATIEKFVNGENIERPENYPEALNKEQGVFCTLNMNKRLRGCIGLPYPVKSLIDAVIDAAQGCCEDPRFQPLKKNELRHVEIEISVLSEPVLIENFSLDKISKDDGLILQYGPYSGLFLPQVWEQIPDKERFMDSLCLKAGLGPGMWKEKDVKIYKFSVQIFREQS